MMMKVAEGMQRRHRRMIKLGSGDASRIICSSLIAQTFQAVRYLILPRITRVGSEPVRREVAEIRHSSLYVPRDFDISPYFMVVKPTLTHGFNYKGMHWADLSYPAAALRIAHSAEKPIGMTAASTMLPDEQQRIRRVA